MPNLIKIYLVLVLSLFTFKCMAYENLSTTEAYFKCEVLKLSKNHKSQLYKYSFVSYDNAYIDSQKKVEMEDDYISKTFRNEGVTLERTNGIISYRARVTIFGTIVLEIHNHETGDMKTQKFTKTAYYPEIIIGNKNGNVNGVYKLICHLDIKTSTSEVF